MKIFKRDNRGLSFFGKKVLNKTRIDSKTTKNLAGIQRFGKKSIDEIIFIIIYIRWIHIIYVRS